MGHLDLVAKLRSSQQRVREPRVSVWPFPPSDLSLEASFASWKQHGVGWLSAALVTDHSCT